MERLFREEDVIKAMEDNSVMVEVFGKKRKMIDAMMMCCDIADMPTAFNVEAVVDELRTLKVRYYLTIANMGSEALDFTYIHVGSAIDKAIEIVKGGVK